MARRLVLTAAAVAICACGGSAPAAPGPLPQFQLAPGSYVLRVSISQTTTVSPLGFTMSALVCIGSGPGAIALPVTVSQENGEWVARPSNGTLLLRLQEIAGGVRGVIAGTASQAGVTVVIGADANAEAPATLPDTAYSGSGVGGPIQGAVRFQTPQSEQSCSSNAWSLARS